MIADLTPAEEYMLGHIRPEADIDIGPAPAELVEWLRRSAIPLATAEPGSGIGDLRPLRAIVGEARIVGLGEATHGTHEFFTLKHRLFEFLVEELGFRTFGFEVGFAESLPTCDYILGADNREEARAALPRTWNSAEIVAVIEWMRAWNARSIGDRQLRFYGFDMQSPTTALTAAMAAARGVDPTAARVLETDLTPLASSFGAMNYRAMPEDARRRVQRALQALEALLESAAATASPGPTLDALRRARVLARSAVRAEAYSFFPTQKHRDEAMAATVKDLLELEGPQSRIALWAHNGHTQCGHLIELVGGARVPTMGELLDRDLGQGYVRVSFAFDRGAFHAEQVLGGSARDFTVGPAPSHTLDGALAQTGFELAAFPLRDAPDQGPGADWLAARPGARCIGGASSEGLADLSFVRADPRVAADVIVFLAETTAAGVTPEDTDTSDAGKKPHVDEPTAVADSNLLFTHVDATGWPKGWEIPASNGAATLSVEAGSNAVLRLTAGQEHNGEISATHEVRVPGTGRRSVTVRGELCATPGDWPSGAHLGLHYASTAPVGEQLVSPPFALAPSFPVTRPDWQPVRVSLDLPESSPTIQLSLTLVGTGIARLRGLAIEVQDL